MAYLILILLFAAPMLLFLKIQGIFKGFTLLKFSRALNHAAIVYLILSLAFALLMAYMETYIYLDGKETDITNEIMSAGTSFVTIFFIIILPLVLVFALIRLLFGRKLKVAAAKPETYNDIDKSH